MDHDVNCNGNNASNNKLLAVTTLNNGDDIQIMWKDKAKMKMMMMIQTKLKLYFIILR